jgi:glyoxylase-like metal-dependent hydrolase (beta-lactamase superfamily II)/rhodanese-related sulfurtransferase
MKIEQLYTGCLAEAAYYIESNGEVAIIDPLRETEPYTKKAEEDGAKIKYVLETHFHADFVSGHIDLAKKTGAKIVYGPTANANYDIHVAQDGEELPLGNIKIKVLHTPGHTMESTTYLVIDENGNPHSIYTGDTLFIGDVGRPDLAVKSDLSREDLAGFLYESLHNKIMTLPDDVIVYPGHGAGSACGKKMSKETWDTLGNQKKVNYALQPMSKEEFIKEVTEGLVAPPQYFPKNAVMNKTGYESIDTVLQKGTVPLDVDTFEYMANHESAIVIDTRSEQQFIEDHIPNSIFIGIDGSFAPWVGALIPDLDQPILLVTNDGREEEIVTRLARVGYDNSLGYLKGGVEAWKAAGKETDHINSITASTLSEKMNDDLHVIDVRKESEYRSEHVIGAENLPLDFINDLMSKWDADEEYHVHCAGGYRSLIAISILKSRGYTKLINIEGGFNAIKGTTVPVSDYVCPTTEL